MGSGVSRGKKNNEMNSPPQSHPPIMVQSIPHTSISQNNQISPRNQSLHPQQHSNTSPQYIIPSPRRSIQQSQSPRSPRSHSSRNIEHDNESEHSLPNEQEEENLRMHFAQSAMSLGMDNDDLIFNLLYFGDNTMSFQSMFNSAIEETVAAHSAGNTPYKLRPASVEALDLLKVEIMTSDTRVDQNECSICQENLEIGQEIVFLPECCHSFHNECLQRWFRLQSWCPICRAEIIPQQGESNGNGNNNASKTSNGWKANLNTAFEETEIECDEDVIEGRGYYHEGTEDCDEDDDEESKSYDNRYDGEDEEEQSYKLPTVPSVESFIAKQTVDSVMENVFSSHR